MKIKRKPPTVVRDVTIYITEADELMIERADGTMTMALTSTQALAQVKADDAKIAKRKRAIVITRVTWAPGFVVTKAHP